jgi:hypothetical protein
MSGQTNFPTGLDDDTSLYNVIDSTTALIAAHHNNIKEGVKAIERKLGIDQTSSPTSIDYRLGSPTNSHRHDGASGQGLAINPSTILVPSGGFPSGLSLADHLSSPTLHRATTLDFLAPSIVRQVISWYYQGSVLNGASMGAPFSFGRTMQLESVTARLRRAPSGATTALDINIDATSVWQASQGLRPIFPAGTIGYANASPNLITYPSGALMVVDTDAVGSNDPGQDLSIFFVFKE